MHAIEAIAKLEGAHPLTRPCSADHPLKPGLRSPMGDSSLLQFDHNVYSLSETELPPKGVLRRKVEYKR